MNNNDHCISFPCSFPIKAMGYNTNMFASAVMAIIHEHAEPDQLSFSSRLSSGGKYLSITATVNAQSQAQLDSIYRLYLVQKRFHPASSDFPF